MIKKIWGFLVISMMGFSALVEAKHDALVSTQQVASDSLTVSNERMLVTAGNMANANSAGYAPKSIYIGAEKGRNGINTVTVKKIRKNPGKVRKEYDPAHPQADAQGYVTLPDVSPISSMVDLQQARQDIERAMKIYEIATDLRYKQLGLMQTR